MCTCASCEYTDAFNKDGKGFADWPRGNVAGPAGSKRDYSAHWSHCGAAFHRKPAAVPTERPFVAGWSLYPSPVVRDWIERSYSDPLYTAQVFKLGAGKRTRAPSRMAQLAQHYRKAA